MILTKRAPSAALSVALAALGAACSGDDPTSAPPLGDDTQPPVVVITGPTSGATHESEETSVTISGSATDDRNVTAVTYSVSDGQSGTASGTASWSFSITLPYGEHTVTVQARDAANNVATDALVVTILEPPPPTTPTVSAPARLNVEGSATASIEPQANSTYAWSIDGGEIIDGAATTQVTFRPTRAGAVRLTATVVNTIGEASEPGEAVVRTFATVTTLLGEGVQGGPSITETEYEDGPVEYSYEAAEPGSAVRVEVDGAVTMATDGALSLDRNHVVWVWSEAAAGSVFSDMVVVPTLPFSAPYPDFYLNRPVVTTAIADPYCSVTAPHLAYPANFMGQHDLPEPAGAPLPPGVARGIVLKDYWNSPTPTTNEGCPTSDWLTAVDETLARIASLGADHASLYQTMVLEDVNADVLEFDCLGTPACTGSHQGAQIPDGDIIWTAQRAAAHGLDTYFYVQVALVDDNGVPLSDDPGLEWVNRFFDAYREYMMNLAAVAEEAGIEMLQVSWVGWGTQWQWGGRDHPDDAPDYRTAYVERMTEIAADVKTVFSGKLGHNLINTFQAADHPDLMEQIDWLIIDPMRLDPRAKNNSAYTLEMAIERYEEVLSDHATYYGEFGKPALFFLFAQSHEDWLDQGWIEDGFCTEGCPQESIATDFSEQALSLQAQFAALMSQTAFPVAAVDINAYWFADNILPQQSFPNLSQSIRGKPAEALVYRWFKR